MRELNIDWAALHSAFQMNMPEVRCFLSVEDGRVLKLPPGDITLTAVRSDPQRYMAIEAIPSRIQYQWLAEFINSVTDEVAKERMEAAINGKGAFRRFKDILLSMPEERRRWFEYRDQMMRRRIVEWVAEQGIEPSNQAPWIDDENYGNLDYQAEGFVPPAPVLQPSAATATQAAFVHHAPLTQLPQPSQVAHITADTRGNEPAPKPAALPDNLGNIAPGRAGARRSQAANHPHEIEALRDFLIEWSDHRSSVPSAAGPLELEELAGEIAKRFEVRSVHP